MAFASHRGSGTSGYFEVILFFKKIICSSHWEKAPALNAKALYVRIYPRILRSCLK